MSSYTANTDWKSRASIEVLEARALLNTQIREFFASCDVLEIETPLLNSRTVTDVNIKSISVDIMQNKKYLHTSPEYAMKRLLVDYQKDIYQLCKVFRADEKGKNHHHEFTMLEWYRIGWDYKKLMQEVEALIKTVTINSHLLGESVYTSYQDVFKNYCNFDPFTASLDDYRSASTGLNLSSNNSLTISEFQDLFLDQVIAPKLLDDRLTFIFDFPKEHAALSKLDKNGLAQRFEVFWGEYELANGFQELTDVTEQLARFEKDNQIRKQKGMTEIQIDEKFIASLDAGLPECSGVALGIDRLLMRILNISNIKDVLAFPND